MIDTSSLTRFERVAIIFFLLLLLIGVWSFVFVGFEQREKRDSLFAEHIVSYSSLCRDALFVPVVSFREYVALVEGNVSLGVRLAYSGCRSVVTGVVFLSNESII